MTSMWRTVVLGKGELSCKIASWFRHHPAFDLVGVVPVIPQPSWSASLVEWAQNTRTPIIDLEDLVIEDRHEFDVIFSCFYDRLLPPEVLSACSLPLNLHPGPLPKYRGVRPVNWALKNGERQHGVTIHAMDEHADHGPIYGQVLFDINPEVEEVADVYTRCLLYSTPLFLDTMARIMAGMEPREQDHGAASIHFTHQNDLLGDRADWTRKLVSA
jgi:methionyl-tRNA formyltransferase